MTISERIRKMTGPLSVEDIARELDCHIMTVYRWIKKESIPFFRAGGRIKFDPPAIAEWLDWRTVA